jgi:hypothetical protein
MFYGSPVQLSLGQCLMCRWLWLSPLRYYQASICCAKCWRSCIIFVWRGITPNSILMNTCYLCDVFCQYSCMHAL